MAGYLELGLDLCFLGKRPNSFKPINIIILGKTCM